MRILNWNIGHGGGSRIAAICQHIEQINPDLLALTEFRTRNEPALRNELDRLGYLFTATSNPEHKRNGLFIASKWQFEHAVDQRRPDIDGERWLTVRLNQFDLHVLVVHIPGAPDHKFTDDHAISGARRKELLWQETVRYADAHREHRAIIMGDFNTGFRIDTEGEMFVMSRYMTNLVELGFVDTWRHMHRDTRDYTWYSKRKDKATGKSEDFNGFRLDYIFVSPALQQTIADVVILHEPRRSGVSDHASVVASIAVPIGGDCTALPYRELPTDTTTDEERGGVRVGETADPRDGRMPTAASTKENLRAHFELPPGSLSDMVCGYNGKNLVQQFRPTYFTAEWAGGVLKEVRIWGPRLLQDGSLGKRLVDHLWKRSVMDGGINYSDLPSPVATRLRSYIGKSDHASNEPVRPVHRQTKVVKKAVAARRAKRTLLPRTDTCD